MAVTGFARYRVSWQDQGDSASLDRALAEAEPCAELSAFYRRLAATEGAHEAFWAARLRTAGALVPERKSGRRRAIYPAVPSRYLRGDPAAREWAWEQVAAAAAMTRRRGACPIYREVAR